MTIRVDRAARAAFAVALLLTPLSAGAAKLKIVSGTSGGQDSKSKEMRSLSPAQADQVARRDLLSVLQPGAAFKLDNGGNVVGMTFVSQPYWTYLRYVCREDRITVRYQSGAQRQPVGVEAQPAYHIERLPVPNARQEPFTYPTTVCDERHPGAAASWFAAPSDMDAVRAANMFRMAEDEVKAGRLTPGPCDPHGPGTCRQWILSLDDPSKIQSVQPCAPGAGDDACYVISFGAVDLTISGVIPGNTSEPITPTAITSIRADNVVIMTL